MKHSSRGSVKLNEESGPRANAGHKKKEKENSEASDTINPQVRKEPVSIAISHG